MAKLTHFSLMLGLAVAVYASPPNEISWVKLKYSAIYDELSSLIPVGRNGNHDVYLGRLRFKNNTYIAQMTRQHQSQSISWAMKGQGGYSYGWISSESDWEKYNVVFLKFPKGVLHWVHVVGSRVPKDGMLGAGKIDGEIAYPCRVYSGHHQYYPDLIPGYYLDTKGDCSYLGAGRVKQAREHEVLVLSSYGRAIGTKLPPVS